MENLIFSLNIVLPIFFLILIGAALARTGFISPSFRTEALRLVFHVALPASLFQSVATSNIRETVNARFVVYALISSLLVFFLAWGLARLFLKEPAQIGAAVHGSFRGNFAYVGLAVCQNLLGRESVPATVMVFAFVVPLYNVLGIWILSHYDSSGKKVSTREEILAILKNPLIIAILIALPFSLLQIPIVYPISKTLSYLAQLATPMALLLIGANMNLSVLSGKRAGIAVSTLMKIVIAPLLGTIAAALLGFRGEELVVLYTMHAVPSAANSYIMTQQMNGDAELGAGIVVATSLLSVITMTAGIYWLRMLGLV